MSLKQLAQAVIAALPLGLALPANAADLYGEAPAPRADYYEDRGERPGAYSYEGRGHGYRGEAQRFADGDRERAGCLPQRVIHNRLTDAGWSDFHDAALNGGVAFVKARDDGGALFGLKIDRCSGRVLAAQPLDGRYGAYQDDPRRGGRGPF